jgi:membrane protease YdiL (CAAX protease family)
VTAVRRAAPAIEALVALAVTLPLAIALRYPVMWFFVPFLIITFTRRPYELYGLTLRDPGGPRFHLATIAVIFGGYALLYYGFGQLVLGRNFVPAAPPSFDFAVTQLIAVGLSEEFFFRGYLQTHLNLYFGRPWQFLGARFGWGLILAAVLFGVCHVFTGDFTRLQVIFFGLFAGWLRERTDTIAVPAAYHGVANILHDFLARSMRSG